MRLRVLLPLTVLGMLAYGGCQCGGGVQFDDQDAGDDGGDPNANNTGVLDDGGTPLDAGVAADGGTPVVLADGGTCYTAACSGRLYACGNCLDDDGDGLIDAQDPTCLGPCHNTESSFATGIPGGTGGSTCGSLDCYFDPNSGNGDDKCEWSHSCYQPNPGNCNNSQKYCPGSQLQACLDFCVPRVPNGCDCFGCCSVFQADGGSRDVFLGSGDITGTACDLSTASDPNVCKSCQKVAGCQKACGRCQLCLGKTQLPADCTTAPTDGGTVNQQRCPSGGQACGLPGDPACPANYFCVTGCCITIL